MKIEDLLDLTLREILDKYVAVRNLECGYFYGIAPVELIEDLYNEYNIEEDYPEAFNPESVVDNELIVSFDDELLTSDKLKRIMDNLGISKKGD